MNVFRHKYNIRFPTYCTVKFKFSINVVNVKYFKYYQNMYVFTARRLHCQPLQKKLVDNNYILVIIEKVAI